MATPTTQELRALQMRVAQLEATVNTLRELAVIAEDLQNDSDVSSKRVFDYVDRKHTLLAKLERPKPLDRSVKPG